MELGHFSLSLSVKDISSSKAFYAKLGFTEFGGDADETTTGPASFVVHDPDGNPILVDQHV